MDRMTSDVCRLPRLNGLCHSDSNPPLEVKISHVRILFPFSQRLFSFYPLNIFESHSIHALDAERVFSLSFICVFPFLSVFPISFNDFHAHWLLSRMWRIKSEINKPEK